MSSSRLHTPSKRGLPDADAAAVAEAEELIAASRGGAQRFKGRMIESMHVDEAKLTIERSRHRTGAAPS